MPEEIHLSVIIPAYNEENRLPNTLKSLGRYFSEQKYNYEIIVASDGSKDRTAQVTKNLEREIKNLKLIDNKENHGKGFVVRQGMLAAKGKYRLFADADNSTSIDQVEKMLLEFERGYDVVVGSRDVKGAVLDPPQPLFRRLTGEIFKLFRKIVVGLWEIEDTQCGFKGIKDKVVEDVFPQCKIDRFAFDPEILLLAKKKGYKIKEIPITWKNDLESKVKFQSMVKMAIDLIKIRKNLIKGLYD